MLPKLALCILVLSVTRSFYADADRFPGLDVLRSTVTPEKQEEAVRQLIGRVFGGPYAEQFTLQVDPTLLGDNDVVIIDRGPNETIKITAGSGVAVAWGVSQFLRNCCQVHISWDGNQVGLPNQLPHPAARATFNSIGRFRYYANVCTYSYSYVFWDWSTWEQHLDWMALNGVNLPLASVATEAISQRVFRKLGLAQADIDAYFTGPAFLAWHRMGNLKAWAGPLSQNWHDTQIKLQHQILDRMVDLGMTPVLNGFAGHVPDAFENLYPQANLTNLTWSVFNCTYTCTKFLEPTDPLFIRIGKMFLTEMKNEFGLYHAYAVDLFNEMTPRSYDKAYISALTKAVYRSMTAVDPDAVWVMQAWMFLGEIGWRLSDSAKSLITAVPLGKLLLLDINSEQRPVWQWFESFYGRPWIWNVLHNSGGTQGFFGAATKINEYLYNATSYPNSSLVGVGLAMEGIYQNYPIYQFTWDRAWSSRRQKLDQVTWISNYARQRYGKYDEYLHNAWELLWATVYDQQNMPNAYIPKSRSRPDRDRMGLGPGYGPGVVRVSPLTERPSFNMESEPGYNPQALCTAWKYFAYQAEAHGNNSLFRLDLVDITREALMMIAASKYRLMLQAYEKNDSALVASLGNEFLHLFDEVERILSTHEHFIFGRWIKQARAKGKTRAESDLYEYNMRNQVTLWGPTGVSPDYAKKEWAGLIAQYYRPRWFMFISALLDSLLPGGTPYSQERFNQLVFTMVEQPYTFKRGTHPSEPTGDSVKLARQFYRKYASDCQAVS